MPGFGRRIRFATIQVCCSNLPFFSPVSDRGRVARLPRPWFARLLTTGKLSQFVTKSTDVTPQDQSMVRALQLSKNP